MHWVAKVFEWANAHSAVLAMIAASVTFLYRRTGHWRRKREADRQRERQAQAKVQADATLEQMNSVYLRTPRFEQHEQEMREAVADLKKTLEAQIERVMDRCNCQDNIILGIPQTVKQEFEKLTHCLSRAKRRTVKKPRAK